MVVVIKKGANKAEIEKALSHFEVTKKFDAYKYCGKIELETDAMLIQKKLRDEWK